VRDDELELEVVDDGIGIPETGRRSGLANIAERAARWGGQATAAARDSSGGSDGGSATGGGTIVTWRVLLPPVQVDGTTA
jgi:glucose-6-phosphate-specific signal transduction histidine kinase